MHSCRAVAAAVAGAATPERPQRHTARAASHSGYGRGLRLTEADSPAGMNLTITAPCCAAPAVILEYHGLVPRLTGAAQTRGKPTVYACSTRRGLRAQRAHWL